MKVDVKEVLKKWREYTLTNDQGVSVSVLNFGGIITKIMVPNRDGNFENIVLGYKDYQDYEANPHYLGALVGRVAGRIQGASFKMNNSIFNLAANDGKNHLHGGTDGFHQLNWEVTPFQSEVEVGLKLHHLSIDGEGGYPGNVDIVVTYTLNNENQLILHYSAESDQTTPLALTNHSYFNLNGCLKDTIHNHLVTIDSSTFVELDDELLPTGNLLNVDDTTFDFRGGRVLGTGLNDNSPQNKLVGFGYDHYFIFDKKMDDQVAILDPKSGRIMSVKTNQPGMVMYTSNSLGEGLPLNGAPSRKHLGVCFETQGSPASLHHVGFPNILLNAGEKYEKQTVFTFTLNK